MRGDLLLILILGFTGLFSGCSDVLPMDGSSTGPYDIEQKVRLQNNFIPVMDVNIAGTPKDMSVELKSPNNNVTSKYVSAGNFTDQTAEVKYTLAEPGYLPATGGYEIMLRSQGEVVSSKSFTLEGHKLKVTDDKFNITENTVNSITLTLENEGDIPVIIQRADVVVGGEGPEGTLFTRGISPGETTTITIEPIGLDFKEESTHVNVWFYYHQELVHSFEKDVSAQQT